MQRLPMKQLSSMMTGCGLDGFQHAADAHAAAEVDVLANLSTAAHGGPGVNHSAAVDISADVDIRRHHHHAGSQIGTVTGHGVGHHPHTGLGIVVFQRYLVVELKGSHLALLHAANAKIEQH